MSCDMWFGTQDYSLYIPTPLRGADVSAHGWNNSGTDLNGGGYGVNSFNSHKQYNFSWRTTSARKTAQTVMSFYSGSFGRGRIHFLDPLTLDTNVLPARWADPSITCDFEGPSLIPGVDPIRVSQTGTDQFQLPVFSAQYNLNGRPAMGVSGLGAHNSVFIPVPPGKQLHLGAFHQFTGSAGVFVTPVAKAGSPTSNITKLPPLPLGGLFNTVVTPQPGEVGFYIWLGKTTSANATLTVNAIHARISDVGSPVPGDMHWYGGQGHEGCRFTQPPTYINFSGVDGGQVEFAATLTESRF